MRECSDLMVVGELDLCSECYTVRQYDFISSAVENIGPEGGNDINPVYGYQPVFLAASAFSRSTSVYSPPLWYFHIELIERIQLNVYGFIS